MLLNHGVQSGLLTPNERDRVENKAWKYKEKLPDKLVEKENVLKTATGRGLLLITISIIRHRYKISRATYTIYLNMICIDTYLSNIFIRDVIHGCSSLLGIYFRDFFYSFYEDLKKHYRRVMNIEDSDSEDESNDNTDAEEDGKLEQEKCDESVQGKEEEDNSGKSDSDDETNHDDVSSDEDED